MLDDEGQVSEETVEMWCVEEQAMETDIALLVQVEELEKKVTAASLQVKVRHVLHHGANEDSISPYPLSLRLPRAVSGNNNSSN